VYNAVCLGEQGVVFAHSNVNARVESGAALANKDVARNNDFTTEFFHAESFGL